MLDPGTPGFAENDWVGKVLDLERLRILVVRRTGRCVMPTLALRGLSLERLTLKAIARFTRVESPPTVGPTPCAGVYARVEGRGVLRVGLAEDADATLEQTALTRPLALVLGAEGKGLRQLTREHCDRLCRIATARGFASLNVSNAAAVALHWTRLKTKG